MKKIYPIALSLLLTALIAAGCAAPEPQSPSSEAAGSTLAVTATIGMIADAATIVGGERVQVQGLMGPGIDPHLYKASAGDVRALADADLILYNGLHLEAAMGEVLEEMGTRRPARAVAEAVPEAERLSLEDFPGNFDPHIWFDVTLWQQAVEQVALALAEVDPDGQATYRANAAAYQAELEALDRWARERIATVTEDRRVLITAHDAFNYFGRAYGIEVEALQGISTTSEAGTADVQELVATIIEHRIPAIFIESSVPPRTIEAVQAAVRSQGFEVVIGGSLFSDAMGDAGTPEGTYLGMVRHNVDTIVKALAGAEGTELEP
ncbi:MAG: zinc ABC transporter substrate-binding protein [Acidobacteriota bacterium]